MNPKPSKNGRFNSWLKELGNLEKEALKGRPLRLENLSQKKNLEVK